MNRLYFGLIGLLLTACQAEQWQATGGGLQITLGEDLSVATRATPAELDEPAKERFNLKIFNDARTVYEGSYRETVIPAPADTYTVTAEYGDNAMLALDAPYYRGEQTGVVVPESEHATQVTVECAVANALASVKYANKEEFDDLFSSYSVRVTVENNYVVLGRNGQSEGQSAYYRAGTIPTFEFTGMLKDNGQEVSTVLEDTKLQDGGNFAAARHCILTLSLKESESGVILNVEKVEAETVTLSETIPVNWLPKPKVEAEGFEGNALSFVETESKSATIRLNTASALQDLKLQFHFEDSQFTDLNAKEYQLSTLTEEDRLTLTERLGITLPVIGETSPTLSLDNLIARLQTNAGTTTVNTLTIDVQANDRWSSDDDAANCIYTLQCNRPEFSVSTYPGNIWTKEFTMNALMEEQVKSGNYSRLSANMSYQFSTDGSEWITLGEDLRKADLTPATTYYIRGLYRSEVAGEVAEVTTFPVIELENGNLSSYSVVRGEDGNRWNGHGSQFEWSGWATLNELTTPNCPITSYSYNTRSGTRPVSDVRTGSTDNVAVWIITIGYGYGGTNSSPNSVTPSELFLGVYNTKGIDFSSRPTGVKFYYKYSPYNGDASDIYVQIMNENTIIGEGKLQETREIAQYTEYTMIINYDEQYKDLSPNKISLVFKSGFNSDVESRESGGLINANTANPKFRGSELYIDDISLIYDK